MTFLIMNKLAVVSSFSFYIALLFVSTQCWAGDIADPISELASEIKVSDLEVSQIELGNQKEAYLGPNELHPIRMLPVTRLAPGGVYLGVGTERGLITASINPQLTFLILADYDPRAVFYNKVNLALLRLAPSRKDYLELRLRHPFVMWQTLSRLGVREMDPADLEILKDPKTFQWWESQVRGDKIHDNFLDFQTEDRQTLGFGPEDFQGANYLFNDALFERVSRLAKKGKIQTTLLNLANPAEVRRVVSVLQRKGQRNGQRNEMSLSIFDFSNAWWPQYEFPRDKLHATLKELRLISTGETLFLGTTTAQFSDRWSTSINSHEVDGRAIEVEIPKAEGYPLRGGFYFGARIKNLIESDHWAQFERVLAEFRSGRPLAVEIERVDLHLLPDWRLPEVRATLVQEEGGWWKIFL